MNLEIDAGDFLRGRKFHLGCVAGTRDTGVVGWRVAAGFRRLLCATEVGRSLANDLLDPSRGRAHEVVARGKAEHAVLAAVVCLIGSRCGQLLLSADILLPEDRHDRAGKRLAFFVEHVAGDDSTPRELDVDGDCLLTVREFDRRASAR